MDFTTYINDTAFGGNDIKGVRGIVIQPDTIRDIVTGPKFMKIIFENGDYVSIETRCIIDFSNLRRTARTGAYDG